MPGPPPQPTNLRILRGNPGKRPIKPEPQPERPAEPPEAPAFLVDYARDEWCRVVGELHRLKLLTILDISSLAAYCTAYARWRRAAEALAKIEGLNSVPAGLMIKRAQNPLVRIATVPQPTWSLPNLDLRRSPAPVLQRGRSTSRLASSTAFSAADIRKGPRRKAGLKPEPGLVSAHLPRWILAAV